MIIPCKICGIPLERQRQRCDGPICMACNLRRWKANNPGKMKTYHAKEYREKKTQVFARLERWQEKNPERWLAIKTADRMNRRRTKAKISDIQFLWSTWNGECFYCHSSSAESYEIDHYMPLSKGGTSELENLRIACKECNRAKAAKLPEEFQKVVVLYKSSLIDSKTHAGNEAEAGKHRERLSEKTPSGDAIVRPHDINETCEIGRNDQSL